MKILLDVATILGGVAAVWFFLQQLSALRARKLRAAKKEYEGIKDIDLNTHAHQQVSTKRQFQEASSVRHDLPTREEVPARQRQKYIDGRVTTSPSSFTKWLSDTWIALPNTIEGIIGDNIVSGLLFSLAPVMFLIFGIFSVGFHIGLYITERLSLENPFSPNDPYLSVAITFGTGFVFMGLVIGFGKLFDDDSSIPSKSLFIYIGLLTGLYVAQELGTSYYVIPAVGCIIGAYTVHFINLINDKYRKTAGLPERYRGLPKPR